MTTPKLILFQVVVMPNNTYIEDMTTNITANDIALLEAVVRGAVPMKGSLVGAVVIGDRVTLYYSSPTGDSSDSIVHDIQCVNETQAIAVCKLHKGIWGL